MLVQNDFSAIKRKILAIFNITIATWWHHDVWLHPIDNVSGSACSTYLQIARIIILVVYVLVNQLLAWLLNLISTEVVWVCPLQRSIESSCRCFLDALIDISLIVFLLIWSSSIGYLTPMLILFILLLIFLVFIIVTLAQGRRGVLILIERSLLLDPRNPTNLNLILLIVRQLIEQQLSLLLMNGREGDAWWSRCDIAFGQRSTQRFAQVSLIVLTLLGENTIQVLVIDHVVHC